MHPRDLVLRCQSPALYRYKLKRSCFYPRDRCTVEREQKQLTCRMCKRSKEVILHSSQKVEGVHLRVRAFHPRA
jgi:hypothetical protein